MLEHFNSGQVRLGGKQSHRLHFIYGCKYYFFYNLQYKIVLPEDLCNLQFVLYLVIFYFKFPTYSYDKNTFRILLRQEIFKHSSILI